MELITSKRHNCQAIRDANCIAVIARFGNYASFSLRFSPRSQQYCAENLETAIRADLPSFALVLKTYGIDSISGLLAAHLTASVVTGGDDRDMDRIDIVNCARMICNNEHLRYLSFASILGFFFRLQCGEFDIFGKVTPRRIMEVFVKYAKRQREKEIELHNRIEKERYEMQQLRNKESCVTWQQHFNVKSIAELKEDEDAKSLFAMLVESDN